MSVKMTYTRRERGVVFSVSTKCALHVRYVRGRGAKSAVLLQQGVKNEIRFRREPAVFKRSGLLQATTLSENGFRLARSF